MNKNKPQVKLESGRPVEGALTPYYSSSVTPNKTLIIPTGRHQLLTPPRPRKRGILHSQTGSTATLLPQQEEGRLPSCPLTSPGNGKCCS